MLDRTVVTALVLLAAIVVGVRVVAGIRLPGWSLVAIYLALYALVSALRRRAPGREAPQGERDPALPSEEEIARWPTSGPIGRFGQRGLIFGFVVTGTLALLNPFQLTQIVRQSLGNRQVADRMGDDPPELSTWRNRVEYRLPFHAPPTGVWFAYNGGPTKAESHSWDVRTQRYAYDFVVVDERLHRHTGRGTRPEDYLCWDLPILAPADGVVVEVRDGIRTAPLLGWGVVDVLARDFRGNFVILRHAETEYSLLAHLIAGTIPVRPGDEVRAGQVIGRCGHSGHSSEPHLHVHLQDRADFFDAAGIPIRFADLEVDGRREEDGWVRLGSRVRPLGPGPGG